MSLFDEKTRSKIVLVGSMHYNPHSINLAKDVVEREAAKGRLRAVAVESCETRWNYTLNTQPAGSFLRSLCDNEMQSGSEAAEAAGASVVLADQTIEDTGARISQLAALTLVELLTPWNGGWSRIAEDLQAGFAQLTVGEDVAGIGPSALLNPWLVAGLPLSFIRYPLSIGLKSPQVLLALLALLSLPFAADQALNTDPLLLEEITDAEAAKELLGSVAFAFVETVVIGRVFLIALLEERNFVLARNIRRACLTTKPGGTVVAVMGMAHCNGVMRVLRESRVV